MKKSFLTLLATAIAIQISFCNTIEGRTIYQGNDPAEYIEAGTVFKWYSDNVKFEILKGPGEIVQIDGVDHISLPTVGDVLVRTSCLWDDGNTYISDILYHVVPIGQLSHIHNNSGQNGYQENEILNVEKVVQQVLELVNIERSKVGARPLKLANDLQEGAAIRVKELTRFYSHTRPNGTDCITVLHVTGREWLGENIAAGQVSPEKVVESWMNSPGHRENILQKEYSELGVGYYFDENTKYKHYWVQMFRG